MSIKQNKTNKSYTFPESSFHYDILHTGGIDLIITHKILIILQHKQVTKLMIFS